MTAQTAQHQATIDLAREILSQPSICPDTSCCQAILAARLEALGFSCEYLSAGGARHLWAQRGTAQPLFVFAGHTDVVDPGEEPRWTSAPFAPVIRDGKLYARGAADMKFALACMVTAVSEFLAENQNPRGSIGFLISGDEEGGNTGTPTWLDELARRQVTIDSCLVGEPTSSEQFGDMIKIGRRGSFFGTILVHGDQGHVGYPKPNSNAAHLMLAPLKELTDYRWDVGNQFFDPSNLEVVKITSGVRENVRPGTAEIVFNIRHSPLVTKDEIVAKVQEIFRRHLAESVDFEFRVSAIPFITKRNPFTDMVAEVIERETGIAPAFSTSGGTSDARFFAEHKIPVVEFGFLSDTIHKIDECASVDDAAVLTRIYKEILRKIEQVA